MEGIGRNLYTQIKSQQVKLMAKMQNFTVIIEKDEDGMYVAEVPDLKGCYTQGATMEEVQKNIKEVIELCLKTQKQDVSQHEFVSVQRLEVAV